MDGISHNNETKEHIYPSKYDSTQSIISRICDALKKESTICYICGNGATTLGKKLLTYVIIHGIFHRIARITVSQNPDLQEIRNVIIQQIRLKWIENYLLIFDGFWWELNEEDFEAIGIPPLRKSFKIVFASRNEHFYKRFGRHHVFHINFLEYEEAWDLFREKAGKSIVDLDLHETARKIVDECDGFRISILTIASALKDKPANVWKDLLRKLCVLNQRYISGSMENMSSRILLCYDLLNDEEAQLFFCLCCLFPEDFNIPVDDLLFFWKGLQLFENFNSMQQARDRVECIIYKLKNSFLLIDGDEDDFVKVNDMCRNSGVSISSKFEHPCVVGIENVMKEWPLKRTEYQNCRAMSFMCKTIGQHPVNLNCPNLHLLQLSYGSDSARLPNGLFEGLKNLKVVSLSIPSLLQPLTVLERLRALCLTESMSDYRHKTPRPRIGDLLGEEMKHLEIFSFSTERPYDDFPREIGLLHNLRYLRFNRERLKYIPAGVLSKLVKLEELYLPLDFLGWGRKEEGGDRMNASLGEIESLPQLTALRIGVLKGSILAEMFVKKLTRYHVFIGSHVSPDYEFGNSKKMLEVFEMDADEFRVSWIGALVWKSENLRLKQVRNLKIITWEPNKGQNIEFLRWKRICISDCNELEYLAAGWFLFSPLKSLKLFGLRNLKEIWEGLHSSKIEGYSCLRNLGEIQIMFCRKLKHVLPLSVATQLRQLRSLEICFCDEMEQIFYRDGNQDASSIHHELELVSLTSKPIARGLFGRGKQPKIVTRTRQMEENIRKEDDAIIFPQLKAMELAYLDKLRVFHDGTHSILLPSLQSLSIFQCNRLEAFCYGSFGTPSLQHVLINGNRYSAAQDLNAIVKSLKDSST